MKQLRVQAAGTSLVPDFEAMDAGILRFVGRRHDPEVGINFAMLVHGSQEFRWGPVVVAGEEISTTTTVKDIAERGGMGFYVFESVSSNQDGETVCTGTWTNIVRGTA